MLKELPSPDTGKATKEITLLAEADRYSLQKRRGRLPWQIQHLRNAIPWPIPVTESPIYIACYVGERNYSYPAHPDPHGGIDIQVPKGTPVTTVERSQLRVCLRPDERGLSNIHLVGIESNIYYELDHLDPDSIPAFIRDRMFIEPDNPILEAGMFIGNVADWPFQLGEDIPVLPDVERVYGRDYHHLHFETHYIPYPFDSREFSHTMLSNEKRFNPLLILKE